jgi:hypothetical protein
MEDPTSQRALGDPRQKMKKIIKNNRYLLFFYRFASQIVDLRHVIYFIPNFCYYLSTLLQYRRLMGRSNVPFRLFPVIHDRTATTVVDPHYYYQSWWAFKRVTESNCKEHYDVGSQIDFVKYLSTLMPVVFIDIRPLVLPLSNLKCVSGSILKSGYENESINSISCLHVIEHIGLGRYGDPLDDRGSQKAAIELTRILAPGGHLYLSTPIGSASVEFNAHVIRNAATVREMFSELSLIEFSVVNDDGYYIENAEMNNYNSSRYSCGLFLFKKPVR